MSCSKITIGSEPDCNDLPEAGTEARLILINFEDVLSIYVSDIGVIISIILKPNKVAYEFLGFRNDVKKSDDVVNHDNLKNRFRHNCSFVVYEVDQIQKNNLKRMINGRFVAIVENKGKDENSIEVLGKECGLGIVDGVIRDAYENSGLFIISLATPDNGVEFERKLPQNLGISYENGLEIIDGLLEETSGVFDDTFDDTFE